MDDRGAMSPKCSIQCPNRGNRTAAIHAEAGDLDTRIAKFLSQLPFRIKADNRRVPARPVEPEHKRSHRLFRTSGIKVGDDKRDPDRFLRKCDAVLISKS